MSKLVLIGGGGHCKSVLDTAQRMGTFEKIVITDPMLEPGKRILGVEVIGTDACLEELRKSGYDQAFITVGSIGVNLLRGVLSNLAETIGFDFPTIIDPSADISESAIIGKGTFIGKKAVVNAESIIGKHCIVNTGAIIEHECVIGDYSHISVGSILCGNVIIEDNCLIGAGSTVIQNKRIGKKVVIGANSTVLTDVEDNMKCYGIVKKYRGGGYRLTTVYMSSFLDFGQEVA